MTDNQFRQLCEGIQKVISGSKEILDVTQRLDEKDKYEAMHIERCASIISEANNLLSEAAGRFIIDKG